MASDYIRNADKALKREAARQARDRRTSHSRGGSGRTSRVVDTAMAVTAVSGLLTNPAQPPNTDQLNDAHTSQVDGYRRSNEEATRDKGRGSNGTSQRR